MWKLLIDWPQQWVSPQYPLMPTSDVWLPTCCVFLWSIIEWHLLPLRDVGGCSCLVNTHPGPVIITWYFGDLFLSPPSSPNRPLQRGRWTWRAKAEVLRLFNKYLRDFYTKRNLLFGFTSLLPFNPVPMAPKRREIQSDVTTPPASKVKQQATASSTVPKPSLSTSANAPAKDIILNIWDNYTTNTPQRTLLLDIFMAFLVVVGGTQFVYCVLAGNYVSLHFEILVLSVIDDLWEGTMANHSVSTQSSLLMHS